MGAPIFEPAQVPFDAAGLQPQPDGGWQKWPLALGTNAMVGKTQRGKIRRWRDRMIRRIRALKDKDPQPWDSES